MTQLQRRALGAAVGSAAMLLGALAFQYLGGMAPCKMCIWQRWPHGISIIIGLLILMVPSRILALLGGLSVLIGGGIGFFHAGVEQKWWEGPTNCTGDGLSAGSNLLDLSAPINVVMCDVIPWAMFGVSMAAWNGIISFGLAFLWWRAYASSSASQ